MVLGTMGLEIIFSEGLLIDLKGLPGPPRFQKRFPNESLIREGKAKVKRPPRETVVTQ